MPKRKRAFIGPQGRDAKRYAKKPKRTNRTGFNSVARSRGAAVTGEMKYFDCSLANNAIAVCTSTWPAGAMADPSSTENLGDPVVVNPLCLFAPKVSAALNGRIGRSVFVKQVKVNGLITVPPQVAQAGADTSIEIRLMLVRDMQTNSNQMTAAQLMRDSATSATATVNSFQNPDNFGRFQVLKEKRFSVSNLNIAGAAATIVQAGIAKPFKMSLKFKQPVKVQFNATNGGTVSDIVDNSLHIVCACNDSTYGPLLSYYTRVGYKE